MLVYVLDINDHPLISTKRFSKVRRMLIGGQAKVVSREPFTEIYKKAVVFMRADEFLI